jgi:hypothetical protein
VPKPRSMQSRFILMEGATVLLALFLMIGALILSVLIRSQFSSGVEELHEQIALHSRLHAEFDATVLTFWRYHASNDAQLLAQYRASASELQALTKQAFVAASNRAEKQEAQSLIDLENAFLALTDDAAEKIQNRRTDTIAEAEILQLELAVRKAFAEAADRQFDDLQRATVRLGTYTSALRTLV